MHAYTTETGKAPVSHLSRLAADFRPDRVAKIRRPRVAHHVPRTKGTPEEAALAQALIRALQSA